MREIPFAKPYIGRKEIKLVSKALKSGWLTTGKLTAKFESEFQKVVGTKYALALNSATAGLHLALEAVGIKAGDKVITTPYTFTSTAEVIQYLGATPIFVDTIPESNLIDPNKIKEALNIHPDVKAIIPVHIAGASCDMVKILQICKEHNIRCIEDAAHAFPASVNNKMLGTFGDVGVYSFYATKTMTTGEGGMVVTDNKDIAKRIKQMRLHGIDRDVWNRFSKTSASWEYDVVAAGYKYNLTDIASAIGIIQLSKSQLMQKLRKNIVKEYIKGLSDSKILELPKYTEDHSWHLFIIKIKDQGNIEKNVLKRNKFIERLKKAGIGTSVHYKPLHLMSFYKERYDLKPEDYPSSLKQYSQSLSLPLSPGLKKNDVMYIIKTIKGIEKNCEF